MTSILMLFADDYGSFTDSTYTLFFIFQKNMQLRMMIQLLGLPCFSIWFLYSHISLQFHQYIFFNMAHKYKKK